jgi:penicillin amidase
MRFLARLLGIPGRTRRDGRPRGLLVWLLIFVRGLLVRLVLLALVVLLVGYGLLWGSLPRTQGELAVAGLSGPVRIERDALGIPTIHAANRLDLATGLGFLHGQERFFQMDLSRRVAAGELSALFGAVTLDIDVRNRLHRFHARARGLLDKMDRAERAELAAYVRGVNAGLASLHTWPFEYLLLRMPPRPWEEEDSVLSLFAMFLTLQQRSFDIEMALGVARDTLPRELYELLAAPGDEWDAPLEGPAYTTPPLPGPDVIDLRRDRDVLAKAPPDQTPLEYLDAKALGSNNWAVAKAHSRHGGALLANDMHLNLNVPNIWYRVGFVWGDARTGLKHQAWGASLPGGPGLVVGSNGSIAWGLTNSECDWSDLVRLQVDSIDSNRYQTPRGVLAFDIDNEVIRVRNGPDVPRPVHSTIWGPVLDTTRYQRDYPHALRWTAYDAEAVNLHSLQLLEARSLDEAIAIATRCGVPELNFLAADAAGDIGWTIMGRVPRRIGFDGRTPTSWADGQNRWAGYLKPEETPRILRPANDRLWTANNRIVDGEHLKLLGFGGYARGARAKQIRDRLLAADLLGEDDMLALQRDNRALFLERWQKLLLDVLSRPREKSPPGRAEMRKDVAEWGAQAAKESVGYRLVHEYRIRVLRAVLEPLTARCRLADPTFGLGLLRQTEGAAWKTLQERPAHLLNPCYSSWDELLQAAADAQLAKLLQEGPDLGARTWGERNTASIRHPMSRVLGPALGKWLDMSAQPLDGGWGDMPFIQRPNAGASERMVVSPGKERFGLFTMPTGQSGHPLSPHYRDMHGPWVRGEPAPFLPGPTVQVLTLK